MKRHTGLFLITLMLIQMILFRARGLRLGVQENGNRENIKKVDKSWEELGNVSFKEIFKLSSGKGKEEGSEKGWGCRGRKRPV